MWDHIIITAANERQAVSFREQVKRRIDRGFLCTETKYTVIPDPPGERIGNGGSTLNALRFIAKECGGFDGVKTLIILCSGDSKRVPQYSALGKVFSPVPRLLPDGTAATLFDEIILSMEDVSDRIGAGAFVLSGDVMLSFDVGEITYNGEQAMAIAFPEPVDTGADHGVFLANAAGCIAKVWHKQSAASLRKNGAVDKDGHVNIDTGAVYFAPALLRALYGIVCDHGACTDTSFRKYVNAHIAPSLYVDFFYPLASDATFEGYLAETPEHLMSSELLEMRQRLWDVLRPYRIHLLRIKSGRFIHFGSTEEVLRLMSKDIDRYAELGWRRVLDSTVPENFKGAAWCSQVDGDTTVGRETYIEKSTVTHCRVGDGTIISNSVIDGEIIPANVLLHTMRLYDGNWICKISGVRENPKSAIQGQYSTAQTQALSLDELSSLKTTDAAGTALGRIERELTCGNARMDELWKPDEKKILWEARVYPVRQTQAEAIHAALQFWETGAIPELPRMSMNLSFELADGLSLL